MKIFQTGLVLICVLSVGVFIGERLQDAWLWNSIGVRLNKGEEVSITIVNPDCAHIWMVGVIAGQRGDLAGQRHIWEQALGCSPGSLSLLQIVLPLDIYMPRLATQQYPNSSEAWFWLGETISPTDQLGARQAYLRSVELSPHAGLAWCRLGWNYQYDSEVEKSFAAFLKCCLNGDPGSNGCNHAGLFMERLGDLPQAIEYYRLSIYEKALKRADELEVQLNSKK